MMLSLAPISSVLQRAKYNMRNNKFATQYIDIIEHSARGTLTADMPGKLLETLGLTHPSLRHGQQCADEGYTAFIDVLDCPEVYNVARSVYEYEIKCKQCGVVTSRNRDSAFRIEMFMPIPAKTQAEFEKYIRLYKTEVDYFKCPDCSALTLNAQRMDMVKVLREVIVITFNKFQYKTNLFYPEELEFPSFGKKMKYKLVSKIEHSGSAQSGHYWSHVRRGNEIYNCNDASISQGNLSPTPDTFIIAYVLMAIE
jgi:hypothetical protein